LGVAIVVLPSSEGVTVGFYVAVFPHSSAGDTFCVHAVKLPSQFDCGSLELNDVFTIAASLALLQVSRSAENPGREYYACPAMRCTWFRWAGPALKCSASSVPTAITDGRGARSLPTA
ncbi:hypothetical protein PIB30_069127, partial [Stylosanthes scabra]|nr:hypothetical protein [Stylosanthes scabra]